MRFAAYHTSAPFLREVPVSCKPLETLSAHTKGADLNHFCSFPQNVCYKSLSKLLATTRFRRRCVI